MKVKAEKIAAILFFVVIIAFSGFLIYKKEAVRKLSEESLHEAMYYEVLGNKMVKCNLCPNNCILSEGQIGVCKARKNVGGKLYSMVYGNVASSHVDPIEKKPFFHFLPGTTAYSLATTGCNLQCQFCQNWQISQVFPWEVNSKPMSPTEVVQDALKSGAKSIAFTYSEPTVFYEYMLDIAKIARENGLKTAVVSSGYINQEPLKNLLPYIDAYKIDLKGFSDDFYQKLTNGKLEPVLQTMKTIKELGVWLEVVNLVIPGENDSEQDLKALVEWIKNNLGPDTPLHFSRFSPNYKLDRTPPTPVETLKKARQMALEAGLKYVDIGNIDDPESSTTYCPETGEPIIKRQGFFVTENNLGDNPCHIPGVFK